MLALPSLIVHIAGGGEDWAAIAASISTGVAAIAGIGGTLWQAERGRKFEDRRITTSEKRRLYASYLSALNNASGISKSKLNFKPGSRDYRNLQHKLDDAIEVANGLFYELSLITSADVAMRALKALDNVSKAGENSGDYEVIVIALSAEMRSDLGESTIVEVAESEASIYPDEEQADSDQENSR